MTPALRMDLKINEIFFSIQGESSWAGYPTVFIRTSGCHLRCTYCDTTYAYHQGEHMSLDSILEVTASHPARHVCVTGGEPLLQAGVYDLMISLCDRGYNVSLETSGDKDCARVDTRVKKIIDVKTPDSGEPGKFDARNLRFADAWSEFKFVICSPRDFDWAEAFVREHDLFARTNVFYSPSYGAVTERWLAERILEARSSARFQMQAHKFIWPSEMRGV